MTENIRSNVYKHGTKILRSIAEHYESGGIDNPNANHTLMQLFALVVEGRVQGDVCEETGNVKWSLTRKAEEEVDRLFEEGRIVKGPWL
tara:strand:- start:414 stop:680 length:267 start_codon:yes stop_codon:yes gene_type:complete